MVLSSAAASRHRGSLRRIKMSAVVLLKRIKVRSRKKEAHNERICLSVSWWHDQSVARNEAAEHPEMDGLVQGTRRQRTRQEHRPASRPRRQDRERQEE